LVCEELVYGKVAARPEVDHCLKELRTGDALVVRRLDRLGRNRTLTEKS
jgi:DNA invertase Pin-like site-specific DNA recombinase